MIMQDKTEAFREVALDLLFDVQIRNAARILNSIEALSILQSDLTISIKLKYERATHLLGY